MGTVTKLEELSKARSRVYIDGEFAFVLYKGELRLYKVAEGGEISDEAIEEIVGTVLPKRAKLRCMNLLQKREYTEKQLRDKLSQGGYSEEIADEALAYVKSFHYVDDARYAESYIRCHLPDKSRQRIKMDLIRKGISKELADRLLEEAAEDEQNPGELLLIQKLLEKKKYSQDMPVAEKQKIYAYLMRKGFRSEEIREGMRIVQF